VLALWSAALDSGQPATAAPDLLRIIARVADDRLGAAALGRSARSVPDLQLDAALAAGG
jgi:hypothetical protein